MKPVLCRGRHYVSHISSVPAAAAESAQVLLIAALVMVAAICCLGIRAHGAMKCSVSPSASEEMPDGEAQDKMRDHSCFNYMITSFTELQSHLLSRTPDSTDVQGLR